MRARFRFCVLPLYGLFLTGIVCPAQDSGIDLHANSHAGAAEIGLPSYPGAVLAKQKDKGSDSTANLGISFGDFHFTLLVADYQTSDSAAKVFAFYRKPLSRYGEVLECDHGKPVGPLTVTHSGLTCSDEKGNSIQGHSSSDDHELRAGLPHKFRIVAIDETQPGSTRFGLVYLELPKDSD